MKQLVKINLYQKQLKYNRFIFVFQHTQIYAFTVQINNGTVDLKWHQSLLFSFGKLNKPCKIADGNKNY